jgi:hypothetical protein
MTHISYELTISFHSRSLKLHEKKLTEYRYSRALWGIAESSSQCMKSTITIPGAATHVIISYTTESSADPARRFDAASKKKGLIS